MKKLLLLISMLLLAFVIFVKGGSRETSVSEKSKKAIRIKVADFKLNERQKNILSVLSGTKKHPMKYIESKIGNYNVRTLRRDLDKLQRMGLIKKFGSTKSAFYQKT